MDPETIWADNATHEDKWGFVRREMTARGADCSHVQTLIQAQLVARAQADGLFDPENSDDEWAWKDWTDMILEEHPLWQTTEYKRLKEIREWVRNWGVHEHDAESFDENSEPLKSSRYIGLVWFDQNSGIALMGDTLDDVMTDIMEREQGSESPDYVEWVRDLDTDKKLEIQRVITFIIDGEEKTFA